MVVQQRGRMDFVVGGRGVFACMPENHCSAVRVLRREIGHVPRLPVDHDLAVLRLAVLLHLVGRHELFFRYDGGDCVRNCLRGEHNSLFPHGTRKQTRATTPCFVACCIHVVSGLWGVDGRLRARCTFCPKQAWQLEDCGCGERDRGNKTEGIWQGNFPCPGLPLDVSA